MTQDLQRTLDLLCPNNAPVEIRVMLDKMLPPRRFDSHPLAAEWVTSFEKTAKAVYVVMNPFDHRRLSPGEGVKDGDIVHRIWLLIDVDPQRPSDCNATDEEIQKAYEVAKAIVKFLLECEWPLPIQALSGNGAHLVYAIDLPNDATSLEIIKKILRYLAETFDTEDTHVDRVVYNASRITKLYGTFTRKGPASKERPHRRSQFLHIPDTITAVPLIKLEALAAMATEEATRKSTTKATGLYKVEDILARVEVISTRKRAHVTYYQIKCPWQAEHTDQAEGGTIFSLGEDGAFGFRCQHSHCADRHWKEFRERLGVSPQSEDLILKPSDPMPSAREFVVRLYTQNDITTLHHQASVFYFYNESAGAYHDRDEPAIRSDLYKFLENAQRWTDADPPTLMPFQPTKSKVENVLDALKAVSNLPTSMAPPRWLKQDPGFNPLDMLACPNGLLHIPTRKLYPTTPYFYTLNGIDFPYDPWIGEPVEWLKFLNTIWGDDSESISTVQEIFGYLLTPDTKFQKIFLIVGPPRSGKGIQGRIAKRLVGERNVCSPTLAAFGRDFGKQGLVGKTVAIISDARIGGRTDTAAVAETLLSISGEDSQTIERKFLSDWNGKLSTRFVLLTNELPRITDVSGALAKRFVVLNLKESFYGKEDLGLFDRLEPELPAILNWALEGRDRLYKRGYFVQPASSDEIIQDFMDLGSPEATFLREWTRIEPGVTVTQKDLFAAWQQWCQAHGRDKPGTSQTFGRNVRAVYPWVGVRKLGERGEQERCWEGLKLLDVPKPVTEM